MAGRKSTQREFAFEAALAEERKQKSARNARLRSVLKRYKGDLYTWQLLQLVEHNQNPNGGGCARSYAELADLLWCSEATAKRKVAALERSGFLRVLPQRNWRGEQETNEYRVDWESIDRMFERAFGVTVAECQRDTPPCHADTPGYQADTPGYQADTHIRKENNVENNVEENRPAGGGESSNEAGGASFARWQAADRAALVARLKSLQLDHAERLALEAEHKLTAAEFAALCDDYEANRRAFKGPGALTYRVREGTWPVDGVRPAADLAAEARDRLERERQRAVESERFRLGKVRAAIARECGGVDSPRYVERCRLELPRWFVAEVLGVEV